MDITIRAIHEFLEKETDLELQIISAQPPSFDEGIIINGGVAKRGAMFGIKNDGVEVFYVKQELLKPIKPDDLLPEVNLSFESTKISLCGPNGLEEFKNKLLELLEIAANIPGIGPVA